MRTSLGDHDEMLTDAITGSSQLINVASIGLMATLMTMKNMRNFSCQGVLIGKCIWAHSRVSYNCQNIESHLFRFTSSQIQKVHFQKTV